VRIILTILSGRFIIIGNSDKIISKTDNITMES